MRIFINALSAKIGGGQTFLINLLKHIPKDFDDEIVFLCTELNKSAFVIYPHDNVRFMVMSRRLNHPILRMLWEFFFLHSILIREHIDLLFQPTPDCLIRVPDGCKSVTMFRNMMPFDPVALKLFPVFSPVRIKGLLHRFLVPHTFRAYDYSIFISEYSRSVIRKYVPEIDRKSSMIHHGVGEAFFDVPEKFDLSRLKHRLDANRFYLYVSNPDYYKVQIELLAEWKILKEKGFPYPLVLTGSLKRRRYVKKLMRAIHRMHLEDSVLVVDQIPYSDIPSLLASARALVFASICECCPNILLENMSAGKTVFCSNYAPMPEFGGEAPVYFDPYTPGDLSSKILDMEANPDRMAECAGACRMQAEKFKSVDTVRRIFDCLLER